MSIGRILCVDDEPNLLEGIRRTLNGNFQIVTALGGQAGLEILERSDPFDVVVSDLRMPVVDGVTFLRAVAERSPDTVRILLTGQADLHNAVLAVNEGRIFRFLTKPCPASTLRAAIQDGIKQHQLQTAERVLLDHTLRGGIRALAEMVSLVHPAVAGRTSRIRRLVIELAEELNVADLWQVEVSALLAHVGYVTLPRTTVDHLHAGVELSPQEQRMVERVPEVAAHVLANIPRLGEVQSVLMHQRTHFDGRHSPVMGVAGTSIPVGARLLKVSADYDLLIMQGREPELALAVMRERAGQYDPVVLDALQKLRAAAQSQPKVQMVRVSALREGMVFAEDLSNGDGVLLVARGQEVTRGLLGQVADFWDDASRARMVGVHERPAAGEARAA